MPEAMPATRPAPAECLRAVRAVWDYLDERLPEDERRAVDAHLATCVACAGHFRFERGFLARLRERRTAPGGVEAVRARLMTALGRG